MTIGGLELGVRSVEATTPYLAGLVDRRESPAQTNCRHRGLAVHAAADGLLDTGLGVGVETLTEEGLHLNFADLTIDAHNCESGPHSVPRRVASSRVVVGQSLTASTMVVTRGDLTREVGIAVASVKHMHGHQRNRLLR